MNRRDYLYLSGGLMSGYAVSVNSLSRKSMAATYNLETNLSFSYVDDPQIISNFSTFKLETTRINTSKSVNISIKVGLNNKSLKIRDEKTYSDILNTDDSIHYIEDEINNKPLEITADSDFKDKIMEKYDEDGGTFEFQIQLIIECDNIITKTDVETININIQEKDITQPESGISRYNFEDSSDTDYIIDVWSGLNGNIEGATYTTDSIKDNYALSFDGNSYVNLGQQPEHEFDSGESFSFSWWRKSTDDDNGAYIANSYSDVDIGEQTPWYLARPRTESEFYLRDSNDNSYVVKGPNIADGTWYMQTCVYDADNAEIRLYIDSKHEGTKGGVAEEPYGNNGGDFIIGEHNGNWLYAIMDDLRIYSKALSHTEVKNLYEEGSIEG